MLKLYHLPISFNSRRVWIILLEKGLDFELIELKLNGDQFKPEFLELNPFHHIPVLADENFTIIESLAILDYLEAKYPSPSLLPKEAKSLAIVRMVEMVTVNELAPPMMVLIQQMMGFAQIEEQKLEEAKEKIANALNFFEKLLGDKPYFAGQEISLAEVVAGTTISFLPSLEISLNNYPKLTQWLKLLSQRESWQKTQPTPEKIEEFRSTIKTMIARQNQQKI